MTIKLSQITIRKPTLEELVAVRRLRNIVLSNGDKIGMSDFKPTEADLKPTAIHEAAFDGDKLVSTVRVDPVAADESVYFVSRMATDPAYQDQGIGALVLRAAEQVAIERGAKHIALHSRPEAQEFYIKAGYHSDPDVHDDSITMIKAAVK
jgi:GNAT superfamily N-acetyltransferase